MDQSHCYWHKWHWKLDWSPAPDADSPSHTDCYRGSPLDGCRPHQTSSTHPCTPPPLQRQYRYMYNNFIHSMGPDGIRVYKDKKVLHERLIPNFHKEYWWYCTRVVVAVSLLHTYRGSGVNQIILCKFKLKYHLQWCCGSKALK